MTNSIDSNVLLAQLRTMAAKAGLPDAANTAAPVEQSGTDFTEVLK